MAIILYLKNYIMVFQGIFLPVFDSPQSPSRNLASSWPHYLEVEMYIFRRRLNYGSLIHHVTGFYHLEYWNLFNQLERVFIGTLLRNVII
jgi:hypothetical protein